MATEQTNHSHHKETQSYDRECQENTLNFLEYQLFSSPQFHKYHFPRKEAKLDPVSMANDEIQSHSIFDHTSDFINRIANEQNNTSDKKIPQIMTTREEKVYLL